MTILIIKEGLYNCESRAEPIPGHRYTLEDADNGIGAQNRAFHALVGEYFKSGHSYQSTTFDDFRNQIKRKLGVGFEAYVYADIIDGKAVIMDAAKYNDIPAHVRADPDLKRLVRGRLKSWSDYTKKERRETMDKLIAETIQCGVNSAKFEEIMEGMGTMWGDK